MSDGARPFVSIVLPCRNEERFIAACLDSIAATTYPTDRIEVLVTDGRSEDGTRAIVADYAARLPFVRLLDNPARIVPTALNTAIHESRGEIILRMDAHVTYPPDYVPALVAELGSSGADNVGGLVVTMPGADTPTARAIAIGLAHPLSVGNAYFRIGTNRRRWVDTVPFGCYRRDVFDRIGGFDETLARNEDDEFNFRLRRQGGRILLVPTVQCRYYARATLGRAARMFYQYGYYKPIVARKVGRVMTVRQLVPPLYVLGLVGSAVAAFWSAPAAIVCLALTGTYATLVVGCAVPVALREGWRCGLAFLTVPPLVHFSYGAGYLKGLADYAFGRWPPRRIPTPKPRPAEPARLAAAATNGRPEVSIVVPCRNEARHIGPCLDSILATRFPHEHLEVLVVDGRSDDDTRRIVAEYAARHPCIRLLDNPARITPAALNTGIRAARGDVIVRMDAHATYPPEYVPSLVAELRQSGADNVGGLFVAEPADDSPTARAIALGLSHPLAVGNSYYRIGTAERRWVDTVPFGCYRREVFDRIGMFDEELARNQDDEFNFRLLNQGGRILLVPTVRCHYRTRKTLRQVARMFYQYGTFKPLVARKAGRVMTLRQLVPPLFLLTLAVSAIAGLWVRGAGLLLAVVLASYGAMALAVAAAAVPRHGVRCGAMLAAVFPVVHVSYGFGFLTGLAAIHKPAAHWARRGSTLPLSR